MIDAALFARIRRLFFAEHWKVGTIATELGDHHDTVERAIESDRFVRTQRQLRPSLLDAFNVGAMQRVLCAGIAPAFAVSDGADRRAALRVLDGGRAAAGERR